MEVPNSLISCSRRPPRDEHEPEHFNLKEWNVNVMKTRRRISGEINNNNTSMSRRFSGSYIRSFREEEIINARSFRSNITISSTASSPGYNLKDEIDPSTYSFTTALKALQARSGCVWECLSPERSLTLHSKWSEAERYICNPLSGEVPIECLSSKTLSRSGRSYSTNTTNLHSFIAGRITMSAPLVYSSNHPSRRFTNIPPVAVKEEKKDSHPNKTLLTILDKKLEVDGGKCMTRSVGIQRNSTPPDYSPSGSGSGSGPGSGGSSSITSTSTQTFLLPNNIIQESKSCIEPDHQDGSDHVHNIISNSKCMEKQEVVQVGGDVKATSSTELGKDKIRSNHQAEIQTQQRQQHEIHRNSNNTNSNTAKKKREQLWRCSLSLGCCLVQPYGPSCSLPKPKCNNWWIIQKKTKMYKRDETVAQHMI